MFYKLALKYLFDEDGLELLWFKFDNVNDEDIDKWRWFEGVKFPDPPKSSLNMRIDVDAEDEENLGGYPDYVSGPIPMVTQRLRQALEGCGVANIEYYPVEIEGAESWEGFPIYFAMNIVGAVAAADPSSKVALEAFGPMGATLYDKFLLNTKAVEGLDVFRLAEHLTTVIVSERVKSACEKSGVDTLRFDEIEAA